MTSVVLAGLLVLSLINLPPGGFGDYGSTVGRLWGKVSCCYRSYNLYAFRTPGGFDIRDADSESADELTRVLRDRPGDAFSVMFVPGTYRGGLYALTHEFDTVTPQVMGLGDHSAPSAVEYAAICGASAAWVSANDPGVAAWVAPAIAAGGARHERPLWGGYIYNAASLVCLCFFVWSSGWVTAAVGRMMTKRARWRMERGQCTGCGYDLKGIAGVVCPECGAARKG